MIEYALSRRVTLRRCCESRLTLSLAYDGANDDSHFFFTQVLHEAARNETAENETAENEAARNKNLHGTKMPNDHFPPTLPAKKKMSTKKKTPDQINE